MGFKNIILFLSTILSLTFLSCGDDYKESGVEGRWQLREIKAADGGLTKIDTVFYSFKKDVFEYLKLTKPTEYFHCFGSYNISEDQLNIVINENSFEPKDCEACFDWEKKERLFSIKKHTSSVLELEFEGSTYTLRKY